MFLLFWLSGLVTMAPKNEKTIKQKAVPKKAQPKAAAAAAGRLPDRPEDDNMGVCKDHLLKVHDALQIVLAHDLFNDIWSEEPLSAQNGGREAPLDAARLFRP